MRNSLDQSSFNYKFYKSIEGGDYDDFTKIQDLDLSEFQRPWSLGAWQQLKDNFDNYSIVSLLNHNEMIGFSLWQTNAVDSFAHLLKIIIKNKYRSSGYGFLLLNHSLNLLKSKNIKSFYLEVESENDSAIALYKKSGFHKIHYKKSFYHNGSDADIMTLIE